MYIAMLISIYKVVLSCGRCRCPIRSVSRSIFLIGHCSRYTHSAHYYGQLILLLDGFYMCSYGTGLLDGMQVLLAIDETGGYSYA